MDAARTPLFVRGAEPACSTEEAKLPARVERSVEPSAPTKKRNYLHPPTNPVNFDDDNG